MGDDVDAAWASMQRVEVKQRLKTEAKLRKLTAPAAPTKGKGPPKKKAGAMTKKKKKMPETTTTTKKKEAPAEDEAAVALEAVTLLSEEAATAEAAVLPKEEAPSAVALLRKLARAVQQLNDEGAPTRLEGLKTLTQVDWASMPSATAAELLSVLSKPVLRRFEDPVERHRELAMDLFQALIEAVDDAVPQLPYFFPVLTARSPQAAVEVDIETNVFVFDVEDHAAYKRGKAVARPDLALAFERERVVQVSEPSEALRLKLCELLGVMIRCTATSSAFTHYLYDVVLLLAGFVRDPYHAVVAAGCDATVDLCTIPLLQPALVPVATALARVVLPNLRHRHALVRLKAVEAIRRSVGVEHMAKWRGAGTEAIADLVGFREDNVIPTAAFYSAETRYNYVADLTRDPAEKVRFALCEALGDWFTTLLDRRDHQPRLLAYLLNFMIDDSARVRAAAAHAIAVAGKEFASEHEDDVIERQQYGVDGDQRMNHDPGGLPWPFDQRPSLGSRLIVRAFAHRIIRPVLEELKNWQSRARRQSALLLRVIVVFCEDRLTEKLALITPSLCHALRAIRREPHMDERVECRGLILSAVETLGRYVVPESFVPFFAPRVTGDLEVVPNGSDSGARADVTDMLAALVRGARPSTLMPHAHALIALLSADALLNDCIDDPALRTSVLEALAALVSQLAKRGRAALEAAFVTTGRLSSLDSAVTAALKAATLLLLLQGGGGDGGGSGGGGDDDDDENTSLLGALATLDSNPDVDVAPRDLGEVTRFVLRRAPNLLTVAADDDDDDRRLGLLVNMALARACRSDATLGAQSRAGLCAFLEGPVAAHPHEDHYDNVTALAVRQPLNDSSSLSAALVNVHRAAVSEGDDVPSAATTSTVGGRRLLAVLYSTDATPSILPRAATLEAARRVVAAVAATDHHHTIARRTKKNTDALVAALAVVGRVVARCHDLPAPRRAKPLTKRQAPTDYEAGAARAAFRFALKALEDCDVSRASSSTPSLGEAALEVCWELLYVLRTDGTTFDDLLLGDFVAALVPHLPADFDAEAADPFAANLDGLLRTAAVLDPATFLAPLRPLDLTNALNALVGHAELLLQFAAAAAPPGPPNVASS